MRYDRRFVVPLGLPCGDCLKNQVRIPATTLQVHITEPGFKWRCDEHACEARTQALVEELDRAADVG